MARRQEERDENVKLSRCSKRKWEQKKQKGMRVTSLGISPPVLLTQGGTKANEIYNEALCFLAQSGGGESQTLNTILSFPHPRPY